MTEVIQVRMKEHTIEQLDKFKNRVNSPSRSDAMRRSVDITDTLISAVEKGDRIILESKNGKQRQILISGLNNND